MGAVLLLSLVPGPLLPPMPSTAPVPPPPPHRQRKHGEKLPPASSRQLMAFVLPCPGTWGPEKPWPGVGSGRGDPPLTGLFSSHPPPTHPFGLSTREVLGRTRWPHPCSSHLGILPAQWALGPEGGGGRFRISQASRAHIHRCHEGGQAHPPVPSGL